jgi:hypothetical protein
MEDINRAYRVLGLYPGASQDEVKRAYRDLAQVWHPDRFSHNDRLEAKAQKNFKRINEAFELLRDYEPPPDAPPPSRLSATFSVVRDLGDVLTTRMSGIRSPPRPIRRQERDVLGLGAIERTGAVRRRRVRRRSKRWVWVVVVVIAVGSLVAWVLAG